MSLLQLWQSLKVSSLYDFESIYFAWYDTICRFNWIFMWQNFFVYLFAFVKVCHIVFLVIQMGNFMIFGFYFGYRKWKRLLFSDDFNLIFNLIDDVPLDSYSILVFQLSEFFFNQSWIFMLFLVFYSIMTTLLIDRRRMIRELGFYDGYILQGIIRIFLCSIWTKVRWKMHTNKLKFYKK